jgi:hypothetical protein
MKQHGARARLGQLARELGGQRRHAREPDRASQQPERLDGGGGRSQTTSAPASPGVARDHSTTSREPDEPDVGLGVRPNETGWPGAAVPATPGPVVMLVSFVFWGMRPWTWTAVAAALAVTLLVPAVAADLLTVALIGCACYWFALTQRENILPPGSGTTVGYPFHSVVFGAGQPHVVDLAAGTVMLAAGAWLAPRTIGVHSGLARRNRELLSRVRRLTITRVDAVDTATAELQRTGSARWRSGAPGRAGYLAAGYGAADPDRSGRRGGPGRAVAGELGPGAG